ncbi:hypothetical protein BS17DRAFT_344671 [Gyrodon lividus]|nr:hypothetical protein BS17DRAFT_344671 [Gyrodon lividus]
MATYPFALIWGPTHIGFTIAAASYGATVGQLLFYIRAFPCDKLIVKILVFIAFILDSVHTFLSASVLYHVFIHCRMNTSPSCVAALPWELTMSTLIVGCITFMVQVFYAHRVWIISGRNRALTLLVLASTTTQFLLGLMVVAEAIRTPTYQALSSARYTPFSAIVSATCDAMITSSVFYYLRQARREDIKRLNVVFVQMGLLSFINALAVVVLYCIQDHTLGKYLTAAPGLILSKTYVNSMLAVLNARKPIRDHQRDHTVTMELPAIPTIY